MPDRNDHEILICIEVKLKELKVQFDNHLHFHRNLSVAWATIAGGLITALIIALVV